MRDDGFWNRVRDEALGLTDQGSVDRDEQRSGY